MLDQLRRGEAIPRAEGEELATETLRALGELVRVAGAVLVAEERAFCSSLLLLLERLLPSAAPALVVAGFDSGRPSHRARVHAARDGDHS